MVRKMGQTSHYESDGGSVERAACLPLRQANPALLLLPWSGDKWRLQITQTLPTNNSTVSTVEIIDSKPNPSRKKLL